MMRTAGTRFDADAPAAARGDARQVAAAAAVENVQLIAIARWMTGHMAADPAW